MTTTQGLRFAPIVRVSMESQARQGYSLETQKEQIEFYVNSFDGILIDNPWRYSGQEHATGVMERKYFDKMLKDSETDLFDAVLVCDDSRWARNNMKSEEGMEILHRNHKRLFSGMREIDLSSPDDRRNIRMSVVSAQHQAESSSLKSILNRIRIAEQGWCASSPPIGRKFDKSKGKDGWSIIPEVKEQYEQMAQMIIDGTKISEVGRIFGISRNQLRYNIKFRAGNVWFQTFNSDRFNIHKEIETEVPELLPIETIDAVKRVIEMNRTINHGRKSKQNYLFSGMLLCGECGKVFQGEFENQRTRAYRIRNRNLIRGKRVMDDDCTHIKRVHADLIEEQVMEHIFSLIGDKQGIDQAVKDAYPDMKERKDLETQKKNFEQKLNKTLFNKNRLVRKVMSGIITDADAQDVMDEVKTLIDTLQGEISKTESRLTKMPDKKQTKRQALLTRKILQSVYQSQDHYNEMSFDDRRSLLQKIFEGVGPEGKRQGVYLFKTDNKKYSYRYELVGNLINDTGRLPISEKDKIDFFDPDSEPNDDDLYPEKINKSNEITDTKEADKPIGLGHVDGGLRVTCYPF